MPSNHPYKKYSPEKKHRITILLMASFLLTIDSTLNSQSLVRNGDFEGHTEFPDGFSPFYYGIDHLWNWASSGWTIHSYCHLDLENRTDTLFKVTSCCGNTMIPHSGKGMVKMGYAESCIGLAMNTNGCATYLHSKLVEPLEVGSVYEISMWFYFPNNLGEDPELLTNIGFYFSLKPERLEEHTLLHTDYYFSDSLPKGKWHELKRYIRALCPLQHLTIGAFKDADFPDLDRSIHNPAIYFVDDVQVIKLAEDNVPESIDPTPFCNYFERKQREDDSRKIDKASIYFQSNESLLDQTDRKRLDSFYLNKVGNKDRAFILSGYTDKEGNDNQRLSEDRVNSVRTYIDSTYQPADGMLICFAKGIDTTGNNSTVSGKQLNRRVTIENSNITATQALYRKGLEFVTQQNIPEAARRFRAWIQAAPMDQKMALLHDPRLKSLKTQAVWKYLTAEVKKGYAYYSQPGNAFFLDSLYFEDQKHRTFIPYFLTGYIEGLDTFDFSELNLSWPEIEKFDSINQITATKYLAKYGMPKISQVGRRQVKTLIWIMLHNTDTVKINEYLPVVKQYCMEGEAEWIVYANMFDKSRLLANLPQYYGTQWVYIDAEKTQLKYYTLDHLDAVNARRRSIGMPLISDPDEIVRVRRIKPDKG